jgi:energy-converting hydrogenase Eha subunit F
MYWLRTDDKNGVELEKGDVVVLQIYPQSEAQIGIVTAIYAQPGDGDSNYPITIEHECCTEGRCKASWLTKIGRI